MLCLVTALQAEARPLIAHYKLQAIQGHAFRLYTGNGLRLIVSGIGKVAAAGAVAYQCALLDNSPSAWLNVGIAGHANKEVGSALLAHKITDTTNGKTFYPIFTAAPACPTSPLYTVDQAETAYATDCAYDLEASAFFETAQRFTSGELGHCLKIISDNPQNPIGNFDLKKVAGLVESQLECIGQVAATLQDLSGRKPDVIHNGKNLNYAATANAWPGIVRSDDFAVRWTGYLVIEAAGLYTFSAT